MIIYPQTGYAFVRKYGEGYPCLALTLGSDDSIENYREISKQEYEDVIAQKANEEIKNMPMI